LFGACIGLLLESLANHLLISSFGDKTGTLQVHFVLVVVFWMAQQQAVVAFDLKSVEIKTLPAEWIHDAAVVATAAFINNPMLSYIYGPDPEVRRFELEFLFERNITLLHERNPEVCYCGIDNSASPPRLCCFFMLCDKDTGHISLWEKLTSGLLWVPFRVGFGPVKRLIEVANHADHVEEAAVPAGANFLRLMRMVVLPDYQGKGWASVVLQLMST
jgi:hypothetical protein